VAQKLGLALKFPMTCPKKPTGENSPNLVTLAPGKSRWQQEKKKMCCFFTLQQKKLKNVALPCRRKKLKIKKCRFFTLPQKKMKKCRFTLSQKK
jgi:hypothetical protein